MAQERAGGAGEVPSWPVYAVGIGGDGVATVDGVAVTGAGTPAGAARVAALAEVRVKAAWHGRPVRVVAADADGERYLIVGVDGAVTTLAGPHPRPAAAPERDRSRPGSADGPLPERYRAEWNRLVELYAAGRDAEATACAQALEEELAGAHGPHHPWAVRAMTVRATVALRGPVADRAAATELLIATAERRLAAGARPAAETTTVINNAHALWHRLRSEVPQAALDLTPRLLALLAGDERRSADVWSWWADRAPSRSGRHG
ncbi:hypothetical protein [Streptomyces sp. NPDC089919]|uniref:hypothetical protein n=1 Tax=Streptomyces sp. NPDC089919 TaxID=3155188 RepID=UPI003427CA0A